MLKNKKILIILLLSVVLLCFSTNCFAAASNIVVDKNGGIVTMKNNGTDYTFPLAINGVTDNFLNFKYFIAENTPGVNRGINLFLCTDSRATSASYWYGGIGESKITFLSSSGQELSSLVFRFVDGNWVEFNSPVYGSLPVNSCFISNLDIKNEDGTIFFRLPPSVELMKPIQVEELQNLIQKLLTILVPVGLTIFGTLLLVYLLSSKRWLHL